MNDPHAPYQPRPPTPAILTHKQVLMIVAGVFVLMSLVCAGIVSVVLLVAGDKVVAAVDNLRYSVPRTISSGRTDWTDWNTQRELNHLYQTAVESVANDPTLLGKLGTPIAPEYDSDDLFRRRAAQPGSGEEIEFEVKGPKGAGTVLVRGSLGARYSPAVITVTLTDGAEVEVHLLDRPLPPVR